MKPSCGLPVGESHIEAEFVELAGEASGEASALGTIEVIGAEIGVGDAALEHPVDGRQDGGGDGHERLAWPAASLEPVEQCPEIAALGADCNPSDLNEHGLEPGGPLAKLGGSALAGALIVRGTQNGPRDEMGGAWEALHIGADLGEDDGGGQLMDAGNGHQLPGRSAKRLESLADLGVDPGDGGLERGDLSEVDLQQETLVVGQATAQGLGDGGARGPNSGPDWDAAGQNLWVVLALRQGLEDGPPAHTHNVRQD